MTITCRTFFRYTLQVTVVVLAALAMLFGCTPLTRSDAVAQEIPTAAPLDDGDWPQLGRDPQHTNYSPQQVDPPYCYAWKWYGAPLASRAQPVVAAGRLFLGTMEGWLVARNATTGAPLWQAQTGSAIRHSPAATGDLVITGTFGGDTIAYAANNGARRWSTFTGSSATAPLIDEARNRLYVAATNGKLTALSLDAGAIVWSVDLGAPILATPALSADGATLFAGVEAVDAVAIATADGAEKWRTTLRGQSLADRYPVVSGSQVFYRSQPLDFFHHSLIAGDDVLDSAGTLNKNDWDADWAAVRPQISSFLANNPDQQTFFTLDAGTGALTASAPLLYTFGNNDNPAPPVIAGDAAFVAYRARNGIQNRSPNAVHVTTQYDAELGRMNLQSHDITGLRTADYPNSKFNYEFRLTSDEPAILTMGGNLLLVDNWERLGGVNLTSDTQGTLAYIGHVSTDWPECFAQCGPGGSNPFFPMSGNPSDPAYPFPEPRVMEGRGRGGAVVANNMIYWRVAEGGLAAIAHQSGGACPAPTVYLESSGQSQSASLALPQVTALRPLTDYVTLDLTTPVSKPSSDLVNRLHSEVDALVAVQGHLMPYYLQRGFSKPQLWPYNTTNPPGPPIVAYNSAGNVFWHDPGELLYTMASAYPYLDAALQSEVRQYMDQEMTRYPPLRALPYGGMPWLKLGAARERYAVPFRADINNWPPPDANLSVLYALWLWSKNTDDWSYARTHWDEAKNLLSARAGSIRYYADIAGLIGYARLAAMIEGVESATYRQAVADAVQAMEAGKDFAAFRERADAEYLDPRDQQTGWYLPVFFGMTPEIGLYLSEQVPGAATLVLAREEGNGLRWWYMTRAGVHAEYGETAYVAPSAAWSHFLAHAYILGNRQQTLRQYLDRPWAVGDLFSIQKLVATIGAPAIVDTNFIYLPQVDGG